MVALRTRGNGARRTCATRDRALRRFAFWPSRQSTESLTTAGVCTHTSTVRDRHRRGRWCDRGVNTTPTRHSAPTQHRCRKGDMACPPHGDADRSTMSRSHSTDLTKHRRARPEKAWKGQIWGYCTRTAAAPGAAKVELHLATLTELPRLSQSARARRVLGPPMHDGSNYICTSVQGTIRSIPRRQLVGGRGWASLVDGGTRWSTTSGWSWMVGLEASRSSSERLDRLLQFKMSVC